MRGFLPNSIFDMAEKFTMERNINSKEAQQKFKEIAVRGDRVAAGVEETLEL